MAISFRSTCHGNRTIRREWISAICVAMYAGIAMMPTAKPTSNAVFDAPEYADKNQSGRIRPTTHNQSRISVTTTAASIDVRVSCSFNLSKLKSTALTTWTRFDGVSRGVHHRFRDRPQWAPCC